MASARWAQQTVKAAAHCCRPGGEVQAAQRALAREAASVLRTQHIWICTHLRR